MPANSSIEAIGFDRSDFRRLGKEPHKLYTTFFYLIRYYIRTTVGGGVRIKNNTFSTNQNPEELANFNTYITNFYSREERLIGF